MNISPETIWIAFAKSKCIATGHPRDVATQVKVFSDTESQTPVLVFDGATSQLIELDLRGSLAAVLRQLGPDTEQDTGEVASAQIKTPRSPGRPRLGVVAREVTLLPRHWEWLLSQPGGASVALRKLVEHALRTGKDNDQARLAREAAYRFMSTMAGDEPGFEEASRALFREDHDRLRMSISKWPADVQKHTLALAEAAVAKRNDAVPLP